VRSPLGSYGDLQVLRVEINRLIDQLVKDAPGAATDWQPPVDILECGPVFVVQTGVPGISRENLEVRLHLDLLEVRGRKDRLSSEPHAVRFHLMERYIGQFHLGVRLPPDIQVDGVEATLSEGVLTVILPRREEQSIEPRTIAVQEEGNDHE
jgi:HSP20 family protein